jgi:hypothetical protein
MAEIVDGAWYRIGNVTACVDYVEDGTVYWRKRDPKRKTDDVHKCPLWFFKKHARRCLTV